MPRALVQSKRNKHGQWQEARGKYKLKWVKSKYILKIFPGKVVLHVQWVCQMGCVNSNEDGSDLY